MSNAERYYFADFTLDNYRGLLKLGKKNYPVGSYSDPGKEGRYIIWRHDVDYSPRAALNMARIEAEEGVRATYFVLLHSEYYNLLDQEATACIREILALGHDLGLHFDGQYYGINNPEQLAARLQREQRILAEIFEREPQVFSFHNPTPAILAYSDWQYAGLINSYAEYFRTQAGYCSDSNGYWRFRRLEEVLREAKEARLQVLTHPVMWSETMQSPKERIYRCIDAQAARLKISYDQLLEKAGRQNVDWD